MEDKDKMDKIYKVFASCTSWKQLMLTYAWTRKIISNQDIIDDLFSHCIMLGNLKKI